MAKRAPNRKSGPSPDDKIAPKAMETGAAKTGAVKTGAAPTASAWTARRTGIARSLGALLPGVTREAFRKRPTASSTLAMDWATIAGPKLGVVTEPRRLSAGTLTLAASGPMALELQHLSPQIIARINRHFGQVVVERLRFVQDATLPLPRTPRPPRGPAQPVEGVQDEELAAALGRLGAAIAARKRR